MRSISLLAFVVLFLLSPTHADDDARVGTVVDKQGTALVKPVGRDRWTPVGPKSVLMPGDLVRTPVRGANAVEIRFAGKGKLLVGPGALVELPAAGSVKLLRGDIETTAVEKVELPGFLGPNTGPIDTSKTNVFRSDGKKTRLLAEPPRWLTGYRDSTTDEAMGSLIANVDGRDVPLSVGYHKVTVDIRDQIARTTVEQSFVNSTKATLEGVFYFPLPADASISSFAMWIGDEMVEADIVEKQRARAIYEDILRKRKDPGLLEWSGGNLFKARVFPIFGHSEKRIRVQYTQVLPLEGATVRYRYALRSELLRARPLRQLQLKVRISSTMPIVSLDCPSHEVRARRTEHAASAEFEAEEFSPDRDFELRIGLDRSKPLQVVPHRRADDGYFMLLLAPPDGSAGAWQRELLPETEPLDVILIADTSGSMDPAARAAQADFVQSLLALLGKKDRFRLLTCDVTARWFASEPQSATEEQANAALSWLTSRNSLGWTDLDRALSAVREVATDKSVVIYVGDGIGTTGDADPVAIAERIRAAGKGVCHAVSVSSQYEQGVLEAFASIGGGSVRRADDDPAEAAYRLLAEAAQPAIKDLKVSFEGLRTARVYPERLPNLPAGTQQIVLGRFLPTGEEQSGTITVTGTLEGKPVRYSTKLSIQADEEGNSFLPRLWARRHLDALLAQGRSAEVQEEIVAFSEEYGIMTPYTSFLVLENDAQREEYGVTRRVRMRDGERFFAEGRDAATTALLQQQMKLARSWRLRLRERMLREIATLGRHLHQHPQGDWAVEVANAAIGLGGGGGKRARRDSGIETETASRRESFEELKKSEDANEVNFDADFEEEELAGEPAPAEEDSLDFEPPGTRLPMDPSADKKMSRPAARKAGRRRSLGDNWAGRRMQEYRTPLGPWPPQSFHFPPLPAPPQEPPAVPDPEWGAPILDLLRSLDRDAALAALPGGLRIVREAENLHAVNGHVTWDERQDGLYGHSGWWVRTRRGTQPVYDGWLARGRAGALDVGLRLARDREAGDGDRTAWPFPLGPSGLVRNYRLWSAEREGDVVILRAPAPAKQEIRLRFDVEKRVLTEWTNVVDGKQTSTTRWSDFVQAGGLWWARKIEHFDAKDRLTQREKRTIESLDAAAFSKALDAALSGHEDTILLPGADPTVEEAKQAVLERRARFADYFMLALHFAASQQWDRVFENWDRAEALVQGKPGALWLRAQLSIRGRRGAEAKKLVESLAPPAKGPAQQAVAHHTIRLAQDIFGAHEMLALLDALKPALSEVDAARLTAQWLQAAGQTDRALALLKATADRRPFDIQDVTSCIGALQSSYRIDEAVARTKAAIARARWLENELDRLYSIWTDLMWQRRDIEGMHAAVLAWMETGPENEAPYQRYLSTLVFLGREADADAWTAQQLAGEPGYGAGAAISYALGYGWNFYTNRVEEKWYSPLGAIARKLVRDEDAQHWQWGWRIFGHNAFMATDVGAALRAQLLADLVAKDAIETMSVPLLGRYVSLLRWDRNSIGDAEWRAVTDRLKARWKASEKGYARNTLAGHVLTLLDARGERLEAIAFLRERERKPEIARQLVTRLTQLDWTAAIEGELLALLGDLHAEDRKDEQRMQAAGLAVTQLVEQLEEMRYRALMGPKAEQEKLPRAELRLKQRTARVEARKALAESLAAAGRAADEWNAPWLALERLCLMARTGTGDVNGNTRELFGSAEDRVLKERCAYVLAFLATRAKAPDGLADAVLAFLTARTGEEIDWRWHRFRLLVALSRTDELTATLKSWISPTDAESRWRLALGYLMAEEAELEEAVAQFEAVARADELGSLEYATMADWLLVLDRKKERDRALERRYEVMPEYQLQQRVWQEYYQVANNRGDNPPKEFDPDTIRALRALLAKATYPANQAHLVRSLYRAIKDFRVLGCLPYGAIGHTPQGVYPFLQQTTSILAGVHEEATCDTFAASITGLLAGERSELDRRALLLLLSAVERRASEVLNAPGPHEKRGLKALQDAFQGEWQSGEPRLMASWLASLGRIPNEAFAAEQYRQLAALQDKEPAGSVDRLWIAQYLAQTLWAYGRHGNAIDTITVAIDEYKQGEPLPSEANSAMGQLINWLEQRRMHGVAEGRLAAEMAAASGRPQRMWLQQRLFRVYVHAAGHDGSLSFGRGRALFEGARARMDKAMWSDGPDQVAGTLSQYCNLHAAAKAGAELERFSGEKLPELLTTALTDRSNLIQIVAKSLNSLRGPRIALQFLIVQMESEPAWLAKVGRDGWRNHAWMVARWRRDAGDLGDWAPRLLKLATRALEEELLTLRNPSHSLYRINSGYFWTDKADAFRGVALKVIELNPDSIARVRHGAGYLWNGLHEFNQAIDALFAADARGKLDESGRWTLVFWLHHQKRWKESLPLLEVLVAARPDNLGYAQARIRALYFSDGKERALSLLDAAEKRSRELKRWNESVIASFARLAGECAFHERAVRYYEELIPLHQRTHRNRGVGQGTLSSYYAELSRSDLALGKLDEAVDAASAAVVSWGRTQRNRQQAIDALFSIFRETGDLDGYVERYEARVAESGLDAPLIRKGIGAAYLERKETAKAIPQLVAARELQPDDSTTHALLLEAYDRAGDAGKAIEALRDGIRMSPLTLDLYADLGTRLEKQGNAQEAERAWTTLVEVLPNEAASHRRLAEHREAQNEFAAAVEQWRQVVRVRTDEGQGWLRLAAAQIKANDKQGARQTLRRILATEWTDAGIHDKAESLLRQLE